MVNKLRSEKYFNLNEHISPTSEDSANLFFHCSGYGSQVRDISKDESNGRDVTICPIDFEAAGMITDIIRKKMLSKYLIILNYLL